MTQQVIIIHNSELLRKGLSAMFDDMQAIRVFCYGDFSEIVRSDHITAQKLMLIIPVSCPHTEAVLELRTKVADHLLLGLQIFPDESFDGNVFDRVFTLEVSEGQLRKIARKFFEKEKHSVTDELTGREREVLRLIALGQTNKAIAESLFISMHTVISHRKNITEKLGIKSIPGLTVYAIIQKIVGPGDISPEQLS